jgi:hypothetical protein
VVKSYTMATKNQEVSQHNNTQDLETSDLRAAHRACAASKDAVEMCAAGPEGTSLLAKN